jgi:hypothetical protein
MEGEAGASVWMVAAFMGGVVVGFCLACVALRKVLEVRE